MIYSEIFVFSGRAGFSFFLKKYELDFPFFLKKDKLDLPFYPLVSIFGTVCLVFLTGRLPYLCSGTQAASTEFIVIG